MGCLDDPREWEQVHRRYAPSFEKCRKIKQCSHKATYAKFYELQFFFLGGRGGGGGRTRTP